jgi:hypothetical protein
MVYLNMKSLLRTELGSFNTKLSLEKTDNHLSPTFQLSSGKKTEAYMMGRIRLSSLSLKIPDLVVELLSC